MESVFESLGWRVVHRRLLPGRSAETVSPSVLRVSLQSRLLLSKLPSGLYRHQQRAIEALLHATDVCLTTGTASGKTLVFHVAGIETLVRNKDARVMAIYPMKALAREQEQRWQAALAGAGLAAQVGRIDGDVDQHLRKGILERCGVVLMTPDVIHAWLLSNLSQKFVRRFLSRVRLLIVDEVHVYTGVFGSNSAFVYRRLLHAIDVLSAGAQVRCVGASATIADPHSHLNNLISREFLIVSQTDDTSPRHPVEVVFLQPPSSPDLNTSAARLLGALALQDGARFIAFVDSRKQTERLSTVVARDASKMAEDSPGSGSRLNQLRVLPYRAGYEDHDRARIQEQLSRGELAGVISTSALELGLDISGLKTAVLIGVPATATSFQQRIGRVGRHGPGQVFVVNVGGLYDQIVFDDPERLFTRPLAQSTLYLGNRWVQYIHAMCFAGAGGEHDALSGMTAESETGADGVYEQVTSRVDWPEGFLDLCRQERGGVVPSDLQVMKVESASDPWHVYPLRDVSTQFEVELRAHDNRRLGTLSFAQVMREAYPGAVYYYLTDAYRVIRVELQAKKVIVRPERRYTTDPTVMPVKIAPQIDGTGVHRARRFADLVVLDANLAISETVLGFKERRGSAEEKVAYPCPYWNRDRFVRNYFTTGVLLSHPALGQAEVQRDTLARLLLEGFLFAVPFDRNDVAFGEGRYRRALADTSSERFIALFDQVYGSLRLTSHMTEDAVLRAAVREALRAAKTGSVEFLKSIAPATIRALEELAEAVAAPSESFAVTSWEAPFRETGTVKEIDATRSDALTVIMPGSYGWLLPESNYEFVIQAVFFHPGENALRYRGHRAGAKESDVVTTFPISAVQPIPGVSRLGVYDYNTGNVNPMSAEEEVAAGES